MLQSPLPMGLFWYCLPALEAAAALCTGCTPSCAQLHHHIAGIKPPRLCVYSFPAPPGAKADVP